jgi:hypothetical protein
MQRLSLTPIPFTQARTSILGALVCAALLTGCSGASEPVAPLTDPPTPTNAMIEGFVVDEFHQCVPGARVELIDGPQAGAVSVQSSCDFWGYGPNNGYSFHSLTFGIPVTVRATAKGYQPAEKRATPTNRWVEMTMMVLAKEP